MRLLLIAALALGYVTGPLPALAQTTAPAAAPADEYFGRLSESVLEIRNRLATIARKSDAEIALPDALGALDNVQDAVLDWQHKYPGDPWVTGTLARLLECYARAGAAQDPHATAVMQQLVAAYPGAPETGHALMAVADATLADPTATLPSPAIVTGDVVDGTTGAPVPGAVVIVAADGASNDVESSPFATTGTDGSFSVKGVPTQPSQYIVVEPPSGSPYAPYRGTVSLTGGQGQAGVIRLAAR